MVQAPLPFRLLSAEITRGRLLSANNRYLTLDGKAWFPVMGEFHYSRYPEADWEREIQKMKAAGIQSSQPMFFGFIMRKWKDSLTGPDSAITPLRRTVRKK